MRTRWHMLVVLPLVVCVYVVVADTTSSSSSTKTKKKTFDVDDFLYHTEAAAGIIQDYEPEEDNFLPDFLYGSNQGPRVVEFYAPWCPHCQHFRKHYINFAQQVNEILDDYHRNSNNQNNNNNNHGGTTSRIATKTTLQSNHSGTTKFTSNSTTNDTTTTIIPQRVKFYAISCTVNQKICRQQGVHAFPKIKLYPANTTGNATAEIVYWKLHAFDVLDLLQIRIDAPPRLPATAEEEEETDTTSLSSHKNRFGKTLKKTKQQKKQQHMYHRTKQQMFDDAHLSLMFNLRNAIYTSSSADETTGMSTKPLANATKLALRNWLELVHKTTPVVWSMRKVIQAILKDFDAATHNESALLSILDRFPTPTTKWSASCTKDVPGMGYSCGLWELFHIISVGLVEYNLVITANDDEVLAELAIPTTHAAETIRNFVQYFFACDECRRHFLQSYDACALDRCNRLTNTETNYDQWIVFPVWLLETHNAVNLRLLQERYKREKRGALTVIDETKSQWPLHTDCPKCWYNTGGWDEEAMYKYLRTEYWTEDSVSAEYRVDVGAVHDPLKHHATPTTSTTTTSSPFVPIVTLGALGLLVLYARHAKHRRLKTGLHKKCDGDC